jgi:hypothetical protein
MAFDHIALNESRVARHQFWRYIEARLERLEVGRIFDLDGKSARYKVICPLSAAAAAQIFVYFHGQSRLRSRRAKGQSHKGSSYELATGGI